MFVDTFRLVLMRELMCAIGTLGNRKRLNTPGWLQVHFPGFLLCYYCFLFFENLSFLLRFFLMLFGILNGSFKRFGFDF